MRFFIITVLFFVVHSTFSQKRFALSKEKMHLFDRPINLKGVIDNRKDRSGIGWVYTGIKNKKTSAQFVSPLEEEISYFLKNNLVLDQDAPALYIYIKVLSISEKIHFSDEKGYAYLAVEFVLERDSILYSALKTFKKVQSSGFDVTYTHTDNLAQAFRLCFNELAKIDLTDLSQFQSFSKAEMSAQEELDLVRLGYKIFNEKLQGGLYQNFQELINNRPGITEGYYLDKREQKSKLWIGTHRFTPRFTSDHSKIKNIWGFAYRESVYIYHQSTFFPLVFSDEGIYFHGYGKVSAESRTEVAGTGAVIGGLVGGFIGGIFVGSIASAIKTKNKKLKVKYYVDPYTGRIGPSSEILSNSREDTGKTASIVIYRKYKREKKEALSLRVNDSTLGSFVPNSMVRLTYTYPFDPLEICAGKNDCIRVFPSISEVKYLEFSWEKKAKAPRIVSVNNQVGEYYSKVAKRQQEQRVEDKKQGK